MYGENLLEVTMDNPDYDDYLNDLDDHGILPGHVSHGEVNAVTPTTEHRGTLPLLKTEKLAATDDPLDVLLSLPVQEFLTREETPDIMVSSSELLSKSEFSLSLREESLRMMLQSEDLSLPPTMPLPPPPPPPPPCAKVDHGVERPITCKSTSDTALLRIQDPTKNKESRSRNSRIMNQTNPVRENQRVKRGVATRTKTPSRRINSRQAIDAVEARDIDVLFGKGGKINKHVGNLDYHKAKKKIQREYLHPGTTKFRKRELVKELYNVVVHDWGGRFLRRVTEGEERDEDASQEEEEGRWVEALPNAAMEKCRQALATPDRSPEERAARRRLFIQKRQRRLKSGSK